MSTILLCEDQISTAYNLLTEWQDEEPREFGVQFRTARLRRDGAGAFHEQFPSLGVEEWGVWQAALGDEDAIIAHLDGDEPAEDSEVTTDSGYATALNGDWHDSLELSVDDTDVCDDVSPVMRDEPVPSSRGFAPVMMAVGMGRSHARVHHRRLVTAGVRV